MSSLYPNLQQSVSSISSNRGGGGSKNPFFFARVNDIVLSPDTKTDNFFTQAGGWAGLGSIKFSPLGSSPDTGNPSGLIARPLFNNITKYPLLEEIVMIFSAPSYDLNDSPQAKTFYYLTTVGIWNSVHHNAFPDIKTYAGGDLNFGSSFVEKDNIRSLLPEEGDILIEGRWGNSIRFSSTTKPKTVNNPWSTQGEVGSPIIIIRNNQSNIDIDPSPWVPIYEDPINDGSSIYLCAGQEIPIEYASRNLKSYQTTLGPSFNSSLQIPDPFFVSPDVSPQQADNLKNEPTESNTQFSPEPNPSVNTQPRYVAEGDLIEFFDQFTINLRAIDNLGVLATTVSITGTDKVTVYQNAISQLRDQLNYLPVIIPPIENLKKL
jgi:hypothetical protein